MSKFVCDFDTVKDVASKLVALSDELEGLTNKYNNKVASDLSTWDGEAKASYEEMNHLQIEASKGNKEAIDDLKKKMSNITVYGSMIYKKNLNLSHNKTS